MYDQLIAIFSIIAGLIVLVAGGESLVRGASAIAAAFHIPSLVIGLTVVAFGTSAPELGVSLQAAIAGAPDVGVGNVVGSNIFNIFLILGLSALFTPLSVSKQLLTQDLPVMIAVSILTWFLARDGLINRVDGLILFGILLVYLGFRLKVAMRDSRLSKNAMAETEGESPTQRVGLLKPIVFVILGLIGLGLGSKWLVEGSVQIATWFGVSELVIGLTIVAAGTSAPEVVTSVVAGIRGERDIAVGNVVGSNLFNLGCVLGLTGIAAPSGIAVGDQAIRFDMPVMIVAAVICLPFFITGRAISRLEGAFFLCGFVVYMGFVVIGAMQ